MEIYHGSEHVVESPQFGLGKPHNDYGPGFYCTAHEDMAKEWAVGFDHDGFANRYAFDIWSCLRRAGWEHRSS